MRLRTLLLLALSIFLPVSSFAGSTYWNTDDVTTVGYTYCVYSESRSGKGFVQTSGSSTTVTAVSGTPFQNFAVGDEIVVVPGNPLTTAADVRRVTAVASSTSITINSAATWTAGYAFQWRHRACGTTSADGGVDVTDSGPKIVQLVVTTLNGTSVTASVEGRISPSATWSAVGAAVAFTTTGSSFVEIPEGLSAVRVGWKVAGDAGVQSVSSYLGTSPRGTPLEITGYLPRFTTAALPTCSTTTNYGRQAWDITAGTVKSCDGSSWVSSGGAPAFSAITSATNTTAAMVVGTGASLAASGSGTIAATSTTGNAATATALAADPADCGAGQVATGIAASGALSCTASPTLTTVTAALSGNATTATALASNGANCSAGNYPLGVNASGAVESCTAAPTVSGTSGQVGLLTGTSTVGGDTGLTYSGTGATFALSTLGVFRAPTGTKTAVSIGQDATHGIYFLGSAGVFCTSSAGAATFCVNNSTNSSTIYTTHYLGWGTGEADGIPDTTIGRASAGKLVFGGSNNTAKGSYSVTADANGSSYGENSSTELLTLNTGGTATITAGNLAPANAQIEAILIRVTTTITTAATFTVKVTGGNVFAEIGTATTANPVGSAGQTYVLVPVAHADQYNASATTVTVTCNANPGAGVVRITTVYRTFTAPTS